MQITNNYDLPHEVYEALAHSDYDSGDSDYSVTTLIKSPRIVQLEKRHWDELSCDAMSRLWSMFGEIAHSIFERHTHEEGESETRLYKTILDRVIGGKFDNYRDKVISDFKVTSAWTLVYGSRVKEWEEQLNMYAYLLRENGYPVEQIRINCVLRDWDKNKALQNQDYPQTPIKIIPITLWTHDEQEQFIESCVMRQSSAEYDEDEFLPRCTSEEMWERPSTFAVMKEGAKRATKVLDSYEEAVSYIKETGLCSKIEDTPDKFIVTRLGKRTRCEEYCNVSSFCNIHQDYLKAKDE